MPAVNQRGLMIDPTETDPQMTQIETRLNAITPGQWTACRMTHEDTGEAMTPEQIGEYACNSVKKSAAESGSNDFLFVSVEKATGPADVCHVGNGPTSPANAHFIANAPADIAYLLAARASDAAAHAALKVERDELRVGLDSLVQSALYWANVAKKAETERDSLKAEHAAMLAKWRTLQQLAEEAIGEFGDSYAIGRSGALKECADELTALLSSQAPLVKP